MPSLLTVRMGAHAVPARPTAATATASASSPTANPKPSAGAAAATGTGYTAGPTTGLLLYGPGVAGDALANTRVGNVSATKVSFDRFKAEYSGSLTSVIVYFLSADEPGYGAGTGGTWTLDLYAVNGSGEPTGSALASQSVAANAVSDVNKTITFSSPYSVTAGTVYALVYTNTDADIAANHFSIDRWWLGNGASAYYSGTYVTPKYALSEFAHGYASSVAGPWTMRAGYLPILGLTIGGNTQGMSYGEASTGAGQQGEINGTTKMVRELFTPTQNLTVTGAGIRLLKLTGATDDLTVGLYATSGNTLLGSFTVSPSAIATGIAPGGAVANSYPARWVEGNFSGSISLTAGTSYYLRLSTGSGSTYYAWVMRRLTESYTYPATTAFADGYAQKTTDGTTWSSLGRVANENDLQFFLRKP